MPQCLLRQVVVVQPYKSVQRLLQILRTVEVVRAQHLAEPAIEALNHAIGLRRLGLGQSVLNPQSLAQLIELVLPCGRTAAIAKQPVCELFAVVRQDGANPERRSLAYRCQKGFG